MFLKTGGLNQTREHGLESTLVANMIWLDEWRLCRQGECVDCQPLRLRDKTLARQWLQQFRIKPLYMAKLRGLVFESFGMGRTSSMTEDDVIDQIANDLSSGQLMVCPQIIRVRSGHSAPAPDAVPFPLSERKSRTPDVAASPLADPPTLSDVNSELQAATLTTAAAEGAPFCQQCQKNK